jgi:hypothetical protein
MGRQPLPASPGALRVGRLACLGHLATDLAHERHSDPLLIACTVIRRILQPERHARALTVSSASCCQGF